MASPETCGGGTNCDNPGYPQPCTAGYKCTGGSMTECGKGNYSKKGSNTQIFLIPWTPFYLIKVHRNALNVIRVSIVQTI